MKVLTALWGLFCSSELQMLPGKLGGQINQLINTANRGSFTQPSYLPRPTDESITAGYDTRKSRLSGGSSNGAGELKERLTEWVVFRENMTTPAPLWRWSVLLGPPLRPGRSQTRFCSSGSAWPRFCCRCFDPSSLRSPEKHWRWKSRGRQMLSVRRLL